MPSILFLTRALDIGGAQRQLIELATGLKRAGWTVQVLLFYGGGAFERDLHAAGIEVRHLDKRGRWEAICFLWRMLRAVRAAKADIVHGYMDISNILLTMLRPALHGTRVVWGVRASNVDLSRYDALSRIVFRASVFASRFADLIICNSEAGRAYHLSRGYNAARVIVIANGVDVYRFRPDNQARREVRAEWGIRDDEKLVGLIGRLDPMKDHGNFLAAAARVATIRRDVRFVCVGEGPPSYRRELVERTCALGLGKRLSWIGPRTDMWRVYNALDLLVSSSAYGEGTSNTIAEAMATGIPCVATDVGDAKLLLDDTGSVCEPGNSDALARTVINSLAARAHKPEVIRARIVSQFSSDFLVKRTSDELQRLVGSNVSALVTAGGSNQR